jgi:hypothetical protein
MALRSAETAIGQVFATWPIAFGCGRVNEP